MCKISTCVPVSYREVYIPAMKCQALLYVFPILLIVFICDGGFPDSNTLSRLTVFQRVFSICLCDEYGVIKSVD